MAYLERERQDYIHFGQSGFAVGSILIQSGERSLRPGEKKREREETESLRSDVMYKYLDYRKEDREKEVNKCAHHSNRFTSDDTRERISHDYCTSNACFIFCLRNTIRRTRAPMCARRERQRDYAHASQFKMSLIELPLQQ